MVVVRWGRSAYETDAQLAREAAGAEAVGLLYRCFPDRHAPPDLDHASALVVPSGVRVTREVLAGFTGGLVIATTSGVDHIDLETCQARGIAVVRAADARRDAVVEAALGSLITLLRRFPALEGRAREGAWARAELPQIAPEGLSGAPIAVVGLGVIGRRMAQVLAALGARVLGVDPAGVPDGIEAATIDDVLPRVRGITLHCSLTPTSRGLLDEARLDRLGPDAVVVNTARGRVLDVEAAVQRVRDGRLRGVAVDVFPEEPYPRLAEGAAVPGVVFTPHSAGYTTDLGDRVADFVGQALLARARREPLPHRVV